MGAGRWVGYCVGNGPCRAGDAVGDLRIACWQMDPHRPLAIAMALLRTPSQDVGLVEVRNILVEDPAVLVGIRRPMAVDVVVETLVELLGQIILFF